MDIGPYGGRCGLKQKIEYLIYGKILFGSCILIPIL